MDIGIIGAGEIGGTPVYATHLDAEGVCRALSEASPERKPEFRATPNSSLGKPG